MDQLLTMDSIKSRFGGKSLQKFSRKIRGRDSSELSISKPDSSGKGKEVSHPEPPPEYSYDEISTKVVSSSRDWHMPEHDEEPSYTPEFLSRSPDTKWIDIEMMGYWLQKCDDEHGDKCRRPFSLDTSTLGRPQWLIDVRRNCLIAGEPAHRYACLSYVVRVPGEQLFPIPDCFMSCETLSLEPMLWQVINHILRLRLLSK